MTVADRYWDEWDENTNIGWWNAGRKQLNVIIRMVNDWTVEGCDGDSVLILRHIDRGLQTFADRDGGSDWARVLREMRTYIKEKGEAG